MPRALGQLEEAREWWLHHRDKAPLAFDEEVDALLGYYLYFQISEDGEVVEILALWHGSRGVEPDIA